MRLDVPGRRGARGRVLLTHGKECTFSNDSSNMSTGGDCFGTCDCKFLRAAGRAAESGSCVSCVGVCMVGRLRCGALFALDFY